MKKQLIIFSLLSFFGKIGMTQTTIWQNDIENATEWTLNVSTGQNDVDANLWVISDAEGGVATGGCSTAGNGNKTLHIGCQGNWCFGTGATYNAGDGGLGFVYATTNKRAFLTSNISTLNYQSLNIEFDYIGIGQSGDDYGTIIYSVDGGVNWLNLQTINPGTTCSNGQGLWTNVSIPLPVGCENISTLKIGFDWRNSNDGTGTDPSLAINNLKINSNIAPVPQASFSVNNNQICQNNCFSLSNTSSDASNYFWDFGNGNTSNLENPEPLCFNLSGQYVVSLIACNNNSCDTTTQNLTVLQSPISEVEFLNGQITALQPNAIYQWLLCPSLTIIPGATSIAYTPQINGEYAVIITLGNGCADTSDCIIINELGLDEQNGFLNLFPNPGIGKFSINLSYSEIESIDIYDLNGRKQEIECIEDDIILITNEKGLYFVYITLINGSKVVKTYIKN